MRKSGKPLISVEKERAVRRPYTLRHDVAQRIDDYAVFLSEFNKTSVKGGDVVEKLAERLEKDPLFLDWLAKREAKEGGPSLQRTLAAAAAPPAVTPPAESPKPKTTTVGSRAESAAAAK